MAEALKAEDQSLLVQRLGLVAARSHTPPFAARQHSTPAKDTIQALLSEGTQSSLASFGRRAAAEALGHLHKWLR